MRAAEKLLRQLLVLAEQAEKNMFRVDSARAKLARFISREENDSTRFLGVPFEHSFFPKTAATSKTLSHQETRRLWVLVSLWWPNPQLLFLHWSFPSER